jgi:flagellar basal-body rod protein FlgC
MIDPLQDTFKVAASGLEAQSTRMRVASENIANADSTGATPGANPYARKMVTFASELDEASGAALSKSKVSRPMLPVFASSTIPVILQLMLAEMSNIRM